MSQVKLNPYLDLGLDPNIEVKAPENDITSIPSEPVASVKQAHMPSMGGITDVSSFSSSMANELPAEPVQQVKSVPVPVVTTPLTVSSSTGEAESTDKNSNLLLVVAGVLFLLSLALMVFFLLKYFGVI